MPPMKRRMAVAICARTGDDGAGALVWLRDGRVHFAQVGKSKTHDDVASPSSVCGAASGPRYLGGGRKRHLEALAGLFTHALLAVREGRDEVSCAMWLSMERKSLPKPASTRR